MAVFQTGRHRGLAVLNRLHQTTRNYLIEEDSLLERRPLAPTEGPTQPLNSEPSTTAQTTAPRDSETAPTD